MSKFSFIEKSKFEKLFGMKSGYVIDFSDRTFREFIADTVHVDIFDEKYNYESGSKANRLRGFWNSEDTHIIGGLLDKLLEYWLHKAHTGAVKYDASDMLLFGECKKIAANLKSSGMVENISAIQPNSEERDFSVLAEAIRNSIEKNEPENALDRLHTFTVKYIRQLCENHCISYSKDTPLHSLFGGYIKKIVKKGVIDSSMTERILKSSISILEAFNDVRNNRSFAHDNPILNYNESILIFNNISNIIRFLETIEKPKIKDKEVNEDWDDLPF